MINLQNGNVETERGNTPKHMTGVHMESHPITRLWSKSSQSKLTNASCLQQSPSVLFLSVSHRCQMKNETLNITLMCPKKQKQQFFTCHTVITLISQFYIKEDDALKIVSYFMD